MRPRQFSASSASFVLAAAVLLAGGGFARPSLAASPTEVAVFNFQMKSATPQWVWLEKYLSDQITTDFPTSRELAVVARDLMQAMASQMQWVPEMATTDRERVGDIRQEFGIQFLISGVCSVDDKRIEITGQIVEAATRKEVLRKTVSGRANDVLDLQKQLSAELLAWFLKKPAEQVLPTLPVWTKSIPAVQALYESMDLYDQGR